MMEIIVVITIIAMIALLMLVNVDEKKHDKDAGKLDIYADEIIKNIERDGYITDETKFDIQKFIDGIEFSYVDISGTESRVEPGDRVLLRIEIYNKNLKGGILNRHNIFKEGIAR